MATRLPAASKPISALRRMMTETFLPPPAPLEVREEATIDEALDAANALLAQMKKPR